MFKTRILTAAIMVPVVVAMIWFLPVKWLALCIALLVALSAWEWAALMGWSKTWQRAAYVVAVEASLLIGFYLPIGIFLFIDLLLWLWAASATLLYANGKPTLGLRNSWAQAIFGIIALSACWLAVNVLRQSTVGPFLLLFAILLICAMDIGGYVAGRFLGKHLLMPRVSPKKTWEGFAGGLILATIIVLIVGFWSGLNAAQWRIVSLVSLVTVLFAVIGDLFESMLKRHAGVKDSGTLLPGHGGVLDRVDSLIAALPIFALGAFWLS